MASVDTTGSTTSTSASSGAKKSSGAAIAENFDTFLLLLTEQLKNQNPLEPLDTHQFTAQLVQFATVEQQMKTNEYLANAQSEKVSNAANLVGLQVSANGTVAQLSGGKAEWTLSAARGATATIQVLDKDGNVVASKTQVLTAGAQTFTWDGKTSTGGKAPDGDYTISVSARDASGQGVSVKAETTGVVDGVDLSGSSPVLLIGARRVPLADVTSIRRLDS
jgi:flagellar basal-body rod modification protein FlgD